MLINNIEYDSIYLENCGGDKKCLIKGVSWITLINKWQAYIYYDHKQRRLGVYDDYNEAVLARFTAEICLEMKSHSTAYRYAHGILNKSLPKIVISGWKKTYFNGIRCNHETNIFEAYIYVHDKRRSLGMFKRVEDAMKIRREAELKYNNV